MIPAGARGGVRGEGRAIRAPRARSRFLVGLLALLAPGLCAPGSLPASDRPAPQGPSSLGWSEFPPNPTADASAIDPDPPHAAVARRRTLRALVGWERTDFTIAAGRARGFEVELLARYEKLLRRQGQGTVDVVLVPVPTADLLPALEAGYGDLAAGGLTLGSGSGRAVGFTRAYRTGVDAIVVSAEGGAAPARIEDLAGRRVHVAAGTHLERELRALSDRLEAQGLEPVQIAAPARLAVEDLLELVGAGVIELTVADAHVARVYARVHAGLVLHPDLVVHRGSSLGWAVRSDDPELRASLDAFLVAHSEGTLLGNLLFRRYYGRTTYARRSLLEPGHTMLDRYREVFERYAARYGFDWLAIAAQAYQESRLDPAARSRKGAVGLMQLLPSTAADPNVGIPDISTNDANVHAGVRYLAFLRDRYFSSNAIAPDARFDFALAAYNLGPNRVRELRDLASEQGLDANRWFGQVERVAASEVGREPVRYVAGVKKTWTAYRSFVEERALRARGRYELRRREAERERVGYSADTLRASVAAAPM